MDNLNKEQIEAVLYNDGPLLILAGAGTGKTKVITSKIAYIIKSNMCYPSQILAMTFTNKAANEMKERVDDLTGLDTNSMWIGTFHSIAVRILRQHSNVIGFDNNFIIVDQSEQNTIVKQIMKELDIDQKEYSPKQYVENISRVKDRMVNSSREHLYMFDEVFNRYNERLRKSNMFDFCDLLLNSIEILKTKKEIKEYYNNKFKYIFVDEYQDTNSVQNEFLKLISGIDSNSKKNITCVGDDDQSIYGWRGAQIKNILKFKNDFSKAKILKLERNYRSTQNILDVSSCIISNNKDRHKKVLYANSGESGERVCLVKCNDVKHEAMYIVDEINRLKSTSAVSDYKQMAILVRAGYQTRVLEDVLLKASIPYIIVGGLKFYERKEIKDCIAYLRLTNNTGDDLSFERIINVPRRDIGSVTIDKIRNVSDEKNISMMDAASELCNSSSIKGKAAEELKGLLNKIRDWKNNVKNISLKDLMKVILSETRFIEFVEKNEDIEAKNKVENIEEFVNTLEEFENISEFLEYVSLVSDNNQKNTIDAVNILTIHSAKGLEFDTVFLPNWQEGVFPSPKSVEENNSTEEERRLAYVAITRAMNRLYISYSKYKYDHGDIAILEPSDFIKEIPEKKLNIIDNSNENYYYNSYYGYKKNYDENKYRFNKTDVNADENYESTAEKRKNSENFRVVSYVNNANKVSDVSDNRKSFNLQKCFHKKFGYGYIKHEDGDKLTVIFGRGGEKVILRSFVEMVEK